MLHSDKPPPQQLEEDGELPRLAGFTEMVMLALSTSVMGVVANWQYAYIGQSYRRTAGRHTVGR